uniref:Uncharacterized protein n=1 Tax=Anguilla anguilla TaxID=7936 RepID=A0A0E9V9Y6_ANGAN
MFENVAVCDENSMCAQRSRHVFHCICCPYSSCIVAQGDASNKM